MPIPSWADLRTTEPWNGDGSEVGCVDLVQDMGNPARLRPYAHVIQEVGQDTPRDRDTRARLARTLSPPSAPEQALTASTPNELGLRALRSMIARFLAIMPNTRA